jgi:hypothetical protein
MEYERYTKKELAELIRQLKEKLTEVKGVEKQLNASHADLTSPAIGLHKDKDGKFFLVELKFEVESKAGTVSNLIALDSTDPSIASFKLKQYVIENIFRKITGGKYHV